MRRVRIGGLMVLLCAIVVIAYPRPQTHSRAGAATRPIQHIIFIVKENRSFDSYFGSFPGVDGATTGKVKVHGVVRTIPLNPLTDSEPNYTHQFGPAKIDYDNGAMDAFNLGETGGNGRASCTAPPYPCYVEGIQSVIPKYWALAQHFVLNDRAFTSLRGPSFPNHLYTVAGGSGPSLNKSAISNPNDSAWNCNSIAGTTVQLYDKTKVFPCFTFSTLADEMTTAGVSWKFYGPGPTDKADHFDSLKAFQQDVKSANIVHTSQFVTDAQAGKLPAFSWIIAPDAADEHPVQTSCKGENWTVQQLNALEQGPDWSSSAMFLTWDDYGGFYDHVAPQNVDALGLGFRAPFLAISPYAFAGNNPANPHVSHDVIEFSSVLKFAEETFGLSSLGRRDVTAGDVAGMFDYSSVHNTPLVLQHRTCGPSMLKSTSDEID